MEVLVGFLMLSLLVLGLLSLLVLEYQNSKARQWDRLWAQRHPASQSHPKAIPSQEPSGSQSEPMPFSHPANVA